MRVSKIVKLRVKRENVTSKLDPEIWFVTGWPTRQLFWSCELLIKVR